MRGPGEKAADKWLDDGFGNRAPKRRKLKVPREQFAAPDLFGRVRPKATRIDRAVFLRNH